MRVQGVLNRFFHPSKTQEHPVPVDILVTGTVPAGSGLSSSYVPPSFAWSIG